MIAHPVDLGSLCSPANLVSGHVGYTDLITLLFSTSIYTTVRDKLRSVSGMYGSALLLLLIFATLLYLARWCLIGWQPEEAQEDLKRVEGFKSSSGSRNIVERIKGTETNLVVFFGSQTGTAQDYASKLAKEGHSRFGLATLVADLEDYDYENLADFPRDCIAIFVLATYGEGEPTDNAVDFYEFITAENPLFATDDEAPLGALKYAAFGLGNTTYEHYNAVVRRVDKCLEAHGASRLCETGEGDDGGNRTTEEDFLTWKETLWKTISAHMHLEEREAIYEPGFDIQETDAEPNALTVYLGEPNAAHLSGVQRGPYGVQNPYLSPIVQSYELFTMPGRNCLHVEFDITESTLAYQTGDHLGIWPMNADMEVERFLRVFGLLEKRNTVFSIHVDTQGKVPFPSPTTYEAAVRYYLEICGPVSRQFLGTLAQFSPTDAVRASMAKLGQDKDLFHQEVAVKCMTLAQLLERLSPSHAFSGVPFSAIVEGVRRLQPRYYSISSSSLIQSKRIAITAVVESRPVDSDAKFLKGVATNYLLALKQKRSGDVSADPNGRTYNLDGPRNRYVSKVPLFVRPSSFKLPSDASLPLIMVGPGTGVAPFRAFLQERSALVKSGQMVGKTVLFFGCRQRSEDFIYQKEWQEHQATLGDRFQLVTAFSRETSKKIYVQHRLAELSDMIYELLQHKAYFYVCGDAARMAKDVNDELVRIVARGKGVPLKEAEGYVKIMRSSGQYLMFGHEVYWPLQEINLPRVKNLKDHKPEFEKEEQEILEQLYKGWLRYWNKESMHDPGAGKSRRFYDFDEMLSYDMFGTTLRGRFNEHFENVFPYYVDGQMEYKDLEIVVLSPTHAYSTCYQHTWGKAGGDPFNITFRRTGIARKKDGQWKWIHEHLSFPVNMATGQADYNCESKALESFKFQE
ncbi:SnoaL-like domain-containing protein [Cladophialophora immunda]|nr:SnoaL-like domain-containing protein [Cladophialophora immunda]